MEHYTIAQRTKDAFLFIENHSSIINTQRAYRRFYGVRTAPTVVGPVGAVLLRSLVNNFAEYGNVGDSRRTGRPRTGRSAENIDAVRQSVEENPETSTRRRSSQLQLSDRTLRRILKHYLHLFPYKIQLVQKLNPEDFVLRLEYARAVLNLVDQNENFLSNLRWPPRSPDLTAPDFFLWGYLKDKVYVNNPQTLQQLKDNI
ncbi:uncharacterized protein LOC142236896 [Haematobia irritans]|uniref:uncharacterized protein LOC142236896 n=1 Tax=Haematobia irritans TaxID=7368 RepID=UPI003F4F6EBF